MGQFFILLADRFTLCSQLVSAPFWRTFCAILAHIPFDLRHRPRRINYNSLEFSGRRFNWLGGELFVLGPDRFTLC
jgi:hypothetical protein